MERRASRPRGRAPKVDARRRAWHLRARGDPEASPLAADGARPDGARGAQARGPARGDRGPRGAARARACAEPGGRPGRPGETRTAGEAVPGLRPAAPPPGGSLRGVRATARRAL